MALVLSTEDQFMHNHPLKKLVHQNFYICDGCEAPGIGSGYRCERCNYNLHEYCATCPETLSTFMHPQHELTLFFPEPHDTRRRKRVCRVCNEQAEGIFFGCNRCEFYVHPLCSQLPQYMSHALHPNHRLRLEEILVLSPPPACSCLICKKLCSSCHYRCPDCLVGVHLSCLPASPDKSSASSSRSLQGGGYYPHSFLRPPLLEVYPPPPQSLAHLFPYGSSNSPTIPPAGVLYAQPPPQHHAHGVYGYTSPTIPPAPAPAQPHTQYGGHHYVPQQPPNYYTHNNIQTMNPNGGHYGTACHNQVQNQCHANHENTYTPPGGGGGGQPGKPQESGTSGGGGGGGGRMSRIGKIIARIVGTVGIGVGSSAIYDALQNMVF